MAQTVSWNLLKHWINEKEHHELQTGQPAPLTPVQRDALNALVPGIVPGLCEPQAQQSLYRHEQQHHHSQQQQHHHQHQHQQIPHLSPSPPSLEAQREVPSPAKSTQSTQVADPDFMDADWVTQLFHHFQATGKSAPEFKDESIKYGPRNELKWLCYCELAGTGGVFPNTDYGFINGQAPCFSTKKAAKQYSAMSAKSYIEDTLAQHQKRPSPHPAVSHAGGGVSLAASDGAAAGEPARDRDNPDDNSASKSRKKARLGTDGADDSDASVDHGDGDDDENRDGPDLVRLVKQLCRRMALGEPQFIVTPTPGKAQETFFDVRVDFGPNAERVPEGLGAVDEIFTKKEAREASVMEVLQWLRNVDCGRQEQLDSMTLPA